MAANIPSIAADITAIGAMMTTNNTFARLRALENDFGIKKSGIYARIRNGLLPKPVSIAGGQAVGWIVSEIEAIKHAIILGASEAELRHLVSELHQARGYRPDPAKLEDYRQRQTKRRATLAMHGAGAQS